MTQTDTGRIFGTGLLLEDGDLVFDIVPMEADGVLRMDLVTISGRQNLGQALRVMVETPFGSDPVNINYGLDIAAIFTAASNVRNIKDVIRLNLVKSLAADDRIAQINAITFDDDPDFAALAPEFARPDAGALARHARAWHALIEVTTTANKSQQLFVSGAAP